MAEEMAVDGEVWLFLVFSLSGARISNCPDLALSPRPKCRRWCGWASGATWAIWHGRPRGKT